MTNPIVFPDALPDIKAWLKANPVLSPLHGGRVFLRLPDKPSAAPFMRIYEVLGGPQESGDLTPIMDVRVSMEAWGYKNPDYEAVRQLMIAVQSELRSIPPGTVLNPGHGVTVVHNVSGLNTMDLPDPDTGWPRKVMPSSVWTVTALTPLSL